MVEVVSIILAILAYLAGFTMAIERPPASSSVLLMDSLGIADDFSVLQTSEGRQQLVRSDRVDESYQIVYQLGYRQESKLRLREIIRIYLMERFIKYCVILEILKCD